MRRSDRPARPRRRPTRVADGAPAMARRGRTPADQVGHQPLRVPIVGDRPAELAVQRRLECLVDRAILEALVGGAARGLPVDTHRLERALDAERAAMLDAGFGARKCPRRALVVEHPLTRQPGDGGVDVLGGAAASHQPRPQLAFGQLAPPERREPVDVGIGRNHLARHAAIVPSPVRASDGPHRHPVPGPRCPVPVTRHRRPRYPSPVPGTRRPASC